LARDLLSKLLQTHLWYLRSPRIARVPPITDVPSDEIKAVLDPGGLHVALDELGLHGLEQLSMPAAFNLNYSP
jgi:hypothetical protein